MPFDRDGNWVDAPGDGGGGLGGGSPPPGTPPPSGGDPPTNDLRPGFGQNGGFDWSSLFSGGGGGGLDWGRMLAGAGGIASGLASGMYIAPKVAQAGKDAAAMANPFAGNNQFYIDRMNALQKDPSQIVNTPGYKFALSQGLDAVQGKDTRSFGLGAGSTNADETKFASGLASQTYDKEMERLMQLSGANWNPKDAAGNLMTGAMGSASLQQSGINEAIRGFSNLFNPGNNINNNNGGGGGSPGGSGNWPKLPNGQPDFNHMTPQQLQDYFMGKHTTTELNPGGDPQSDSPLNYDGNAGSPPMGDVNDGDMYRNHPDFSPGDN